VTYSASKRTGILSNKKEKEGDFDENQQGSRGLGLGVGVELGLGLGKRVTLHRETRKGYVSPRSQRGIRFTEKWCRFSFTLSSFDLSHSSSSLSV
jgi:hypothetical protein